MREYFLRHCKLKIWKVTDFLKRQDRREQIETLLLNLIKKILLKIDGRNVPQGQYFSRENCYCHKCIIKISQRVRVFIYKNIITSKLQHSVPKGKAFDREN
jgi:hypothetical protein